ncbi:PucR C-terminal helix-turn-helix domain-containing protein [Nocardioides terrae]|uniref:PucR C-terminal helix-turn-helix domain-containing protein n=1 Tax=Nocardioides terrae TaxID=574651 RepID=A0A1I1LGU9_9ACTN|nr:helix-turn-helix domain-containing protein [Nocardioides terrae]SFC72221.1 PucR C-terminal helix-turn-helix domain-containing protein [Nocardioides terrae]
MRVTGDTRATAPEKAALPSDVGRAWASLLSSGDAIADEITLTLLDHDKDWYDHADPEIRADLRRSTRDHIRLGLRAMAGDEDFDTLLALWRETGRRRARQGVPLELVLNAYTIGTRVLWEALVRRQTDPVLQVDDHVLLVAGRKVWSNLDVQNSVMSAAYRKESALLQRRDLHRQGRLLDGLVEGRGSDPAFAAEVQEVLGVAPDDAVACVVAAFDGDRDSPLRNPDDRLDGAGLASYWQVRGDLHFGLVQLGSAAVVDVVQLLRPCTSGRVGVAASPEGLTGFCTAFQLAAHTVDTIPRGTAEVADGEERLPKVLLAASPAITALLVRRSIGPVLAQPAHQAEVLMTTLRALLAHHGSPTHAAQDLYCHRNTVIYRMRQLQALTGRDLADPEDRLLLMLALLAVDPITP